VRSSGSKRKPQSPAGQRCGRSIIAHTVQGGGIVTLVRWISPQELGSKLSSIQVVKIGIGGRRPPIGCRRHRVVSAKILMTVIVTPGANDDV
jgi:hypothetical protein